MAQKPTEFGRKVANWIAAFLGLLAAAVCLGLIALIVIAVIWAARSI